MPFAALAAALALAAAGTPPLEDPGANIVEALVVTAVDPGPAWWRVSDGDTTVWILAVGEDSIPNDLRWDRKALERRLDGASSLIVDTRVNLTAGLRDIPALLRARAALRSKTPLEETLDPALRTRFVAARERLDKPAGRYAGWMPMMAGVLLVSDSRDRRMTTSVTREVIAAAKARKVPRVEPARYKAVPFMQEALASLTPAVHRQCLEGALADVETPPSRARAAAEGWARGDVAAALREPRSFEKCLLLMGGGAQLWRRVADDDAGAIAEALKTPGHSVAIVGLRQLLADDGVVEKLQARGLRVIGPGEAE